MKSIYYIIGIILLISVSGFIFLNQNTPIAKDLVPSKGEAQEITLSYKNYNYYPEIITLKVNNPVRIYLDSSVKGCFRDFTIRDLGVRKYIKNSEDYVEFTPSKTGTFIFACSMGMGTGKIQVN